MSRHYDLLPRSSLDGAADYEFKERLRSRRSVLSLLRKARRLCRPLYVFLALAVFLLWQVFFNASYTKPPRFNIPSDETVYIAANIMDEDLILGRWGQSLEALVNLIGKDRVYVSVYGGPAHAIRALDARLPCERSIVAEADDPIVLQDIVHTTIPSGESRVERIAFLSEVRNRALKPLDTLERRFDKVLFLNDVLFEPMDAARLLWGTNVNKDGKSEYKAVCGADFITSWKYYDTFATRDLEGYSLGVPIFPWFSTQGDAVSRRDVLNGRDAVRVKSCWGGIVAFDARYLQPSLELLNSSAAIPTVGQRHPDKFTGAIRQQNPDNLPVRFRYDSAQFWDSSECCLIHADIEAKSLPQAKGSSETEDSQDWGVGIFMNPFVRVAYDSRTKSLIWFVQHFERLFAIPHTIINHFAHMPHYNLRRAEMEGQVFADRLWVSTKSEEDGEANEFGGEDSTWQGSGINRKKQKGYWAAHGHYVHYDRTATKGGFCSVRQLSVLKEGKLAKGEKNWENLRNEVPPVNLND